MIEQRFSQGKGKLSYPRGEEDERAWDGYWYEAKIYGRDEGRGIECHRTDFGFVLSTFKGVGMEDTKLSSSVTVCEYLKLEKDKAQEKIADFILDRFTERYVRPLRGDSANKHGFCTMAVSCLMIEALESFWKGWPDTRSKADNAFHAFFHRCLKDGVALGVFATYACDFFKNVRCGLLHQAESRNGWRIRRDGLLFNAGTKTINATIFHSELEKSLKRYCDELRRADWDSEIWCNLRKKMDSVISNCKPITA